VPLTEEFLMFRRGLVAAVAASAVLAVGSSPVAALTPDAELVRAADRVRERESDEFADRYLFFKSCGEEPYLLGADYVALGTVAAIDTVLTGAPPRFGIHRVVTLSVETCLKGPCGKALSFRIHGGRWGDYWVSASHAAEYALGERAIVVLYWNEYSLEERWLSGASPSAKYAIDSDGTVTRKELPVGAFVSEIEEVLGQRSVRSIFAESDLVVTGTIRKVWSVMVDVYEDPRCGTATVDAPRFLVELTGALKGHPPADQLEVALPSRKTLAGRDSFTPLVDDTVLLFLQRQDEGTFSVVGGGDGGYHLGDPTTSAALETIESIRASTGG
jgi:hypothetical protein